ncbi:MAG TPA: very short patch repair endonuclease [Verrucomicrobiota bacterium]|nr:very short patch repair endonuclease [Verrucomicrobiota bacterium]
MADIFSKRKRSEVMAAVRSSGNESTELRFITLMRGLHITGWRRRQKLPGSPDFVFREQRLAVFVDGCFWHGCPKHGSFPSTRRTFWLKKFASNKARDRDVTRKLRQRGWRVIRIWEHELKNPARCLAQLLDCLSRVRRGH